MKTKRSDVDVAFDHIQGLRRNYPDFPSTFNTCSDKCKKMARGAGDCADCQEKKLAKLSTPELAKAYHEAFKHMREKQKEMIDYIRENQNDK